MTPTLMSCTGGLPNGWAVYTLAPATDPHQRQTRCRLYTSTDDLPHLPDDVHWATVQLVHGDYALFGGSAPDNFLPPAEFDNIQQLLASWKDSWPLADAVFPENLDHIVQAICNGTAHGCCDGSYMKELSTELGAAAWKVEDPSTRQAMWGTTQTSGSEREVNPYRSELQGIHTTLLAMDAVCTFCHITDGAITIGCDNLGGIKCSSADWLKLNQNTKHADLIRAIRWLKDSLPITIHFVHIDGHQDRTAAFQDLPRLAQLNVEMDHQAKVRLRALIDSSAPPLLAAPLHKEGWRCSLNGIKITSDPARAICRAVFGRRLQTHLHQ